MPLAIGLGVNGNGFLVERGGFAKFTARAQQAGKAVQLRDQIDVAARQISIEALVIEIEDTTARELGFSWDASGISKAGKFADSFDGSVSDGLDDDTFQPLRFLFNRSGVLNTFRFTAALSALLNPGRLRIPIMRK